MGQRLEENITLHNTIVLVLTFLVIESIILNLEEVLTKVMESRSRWIYLQQGYSSKSNSSCPNFSFLVIKGIIVKLEGVLNKVLEFRSKWIYLQECAILN